MHQKRSEPTRVTRDTLFEDLGFTSEEAAVLRVKTALHIEILKVVERKKLTPRQLEKLLDVPQSRVSDLMCGKISRMTADLLTKYLFRLGRELKVSTKPGTVHPSATA